MTSSAPEADALDPSGPRVVAIGGGHGLSTVLRAVRRYAGTVTAVVTVADDGGSSGRLRRDLGMPPPGDIRRALVALSDADRVWSRVFEDRIASGPLAGHAVGNLVLAGLTGVRGDFTTAVADAARVLGCLGTVVPSTVDPVDLTAVVAGRPVTGQVAVATATGRIERVALTDPRARAAPGVREALAAADQVVLAPGSLFTSLVAVLVVPDVGQGVASTPGLVVQVGNVCPDVETAGLDVAAHVAAVVAHGGRVDVHLAPAGGRVPYDPCVGLGPTRIVTADVADPTRGVHHEERLATALRGLLSP